MTGRGPAFKLLSQVPLTLPAGGSVQIRVASPAARFVKNIQFELSEPPDGITLRQSKTNAEFIEVVISCDREKGKPGLQGNLLLNASGERANPGAQKSPGRVQRVPLGAVPAIPFEIVAGALTSS